MIKTLYCNKYYVNSGPDLSGGWGVSLMMMIKIIAMNNNDDGGLSPGFPCIAIVDRWWIKWSLNKKQ